MHDKTLRTDTIPHPAMKMLAHKGYKFVVLAGDADRELPDVHGIPPGFNEYGRGGVIRGELWMEGGTHGSCSGHKDGTENGFYWGGKIKEGAGYIYVRGRAGVNEDDLVRMEVPIIKWISQRVRPVQERER